MSEQNVESLRAFWEAWTPGGEMDMSLLDPKVIYEDSNLPDHIGEAYRGHEASRGRRSAGSSRTRA
jgi:hypothetical protein